MNRLGTPRVHFQRTASTNETARELALAGAPHGTLVTASEQTAGRGRQGRQWWAPPASSLLMSLILRWPDGLGATPELLPLVGGVAVCEVAGADARVKWPNDVVIERDTAAADDGAPALAKLAGILVEARPQAGWAVIGIGLNVAVSATDVPEPLREIVASLGQPRAAIEPLLVRLLDVFESRLAEPASVILDALRERDALHGRRITWSASGAKDGNLPARGYGRAEGIDGAGRLIVSAYDGTRRTLDSGEVHLVAG
jgi:BirA family biotin operon repressor/biotin-[acetyl-CoA-carboxylase] ligase